MSRMTVPSAEQSTARGGGGYASSRLWQKISIAVLPLLTVPHAWQRVVLAIPPFLS